MARNKRRKNHDPIFRFIHRTCRSVSRLTMTNVEALVNHARARGICTCHLTMAAKIIEFAKRYVRLEGDAVTFLEKLTNRLVPIPMEARYA